MTKSEFSEKLYDLSMVESVSGGDESFIKKMVALFIETVPKNVEELNNALNRQNWDQVSKLAHKLKSTIDSMGIKSLKTDIREVELNAKQQVGLEKIPGLIDKLNLVIGKCIEQLQVDIVK